VADNKDITKSSNQSVQHVKTEGSEPSFDNFEQRRRILKGAAVAAPLMMTVASRPALGMGARCTPSAWVSGNLSDHKEDRHSCGGKSPGYWKNHDWGGTGCYPGSGEWSKWSGKWGGGSKWNKWSKDYKSDSDGTPFHEFSRSGRRRGIFPGRFYGDKTMMEVLWSKGHEDPHQLGAHIIAAYLNAKTIPDYGMTPREVVNMYDQLRRTGYYRPGSGGHRMSAEEVVLFIQNTFSYSDKYSYSR